MSDIELHLRDRKLEFDEWQCVAMLVSSDIILNISIEGRNVTVFNA